MLKFIIIIYSIGKGQESSTESVPAQPTDSGPIFMKTLTPQTVTVDEPICMDVVIRSAPKAKLYWFYEKKKIHESRNVQIIEEESQFAESNQILLKSKLMLRSAIENDAGKYTIRAINRCGVKSSSVNLVVKGDYFIMF